MRLIPTNNLQKRGVIKRPSLLGFGTKDLSRAIGGSMSQDPPIHQTAERHSVDEATNLRGPMPAQAVDGDDSLGAARVQALCDLIKIDAERLRIDLTTVKQTLDAAQEDIRKEHERVLELVANEQRLLESEGSKSKLIFERGEMALAQAVLVAQQRARSRAGRSPLLKRLHALRACNSQAEQVPGASRASEPLQIEDTTVIATISGQIRRG